MNISAMIIRLEGLRDIAGDVEVVLPIDLAEGNEFELAAAELQQVTKQYRNIYTRGGDMTVCKIY